MSIFLIELKLSLPCDEVPIIVKPLFFNSSIVLFRFTTLQMGILKTAPDDALITVSFIRADLSFGIIIPSTPKNSALLIIFPKF